MTDSRLARPIIHGAFLVVAIAGGAYVVYSDLTTPNLFTLTTADLVLVTAILLGAISVVALAVDLFGTREPVRLTDEQIDQIAGSVSQRLHDARAVDEDATATRIRTDHLDLHTDGANEFRLQVEDDELVIFGRTD